MSMVFTQFHKPFATVLWAVDLCAVVWVMYNLQK